nr:hypothetical protein [Tanacetum cinerariifolium]
MAVLGSARNRGLERGGRRVIEKFGVLARYHPLFEFDDEYISSDVTILFVEMLEDIENKDSYVSNLDKPNLFVTPLFDANEDEFFDPEGFTNEPLLEENDVLFDLESKENEWKKILYDAPIDDLMTQDKVFDLGIHEKIFSPTYEARLILSRVLCFMSKITSDYEDFRARGFVHRSPELQSLAYGNPIS